MNTYKVITLSVGGRNNKIFSLGDKVTDKHFAEGAPAKLVAGGYLELVSTDDEPFEAPSEGNVEITQNTDTTDAPTDEVDEVKEKADDQADQDKEEEGEKDDPEKKEGLFGKLKKMVSGEDTTRNEIMAELNKMGVKFPSGASKAELYKLYEESKTKE